MNGSERIEYLRQEIEGLEKRKEWASKSSAKRNVERLLRDRRAELAQLEERKSDEWAAMTEPR